MAMELALLLRPGVGSSARSGTGLAFSVLVVGGGRDLTGLVEDLLRDADLQGANLKSVASFDQALTELAGERPSIIFLGIRVPDLASLNALVRLQAAAPGVPVVPLPMPAQADLLTPWWAMRSHRAFDRNEVVGLLQQLALLDEGARQLFYLATHDRLTGLANRWLLEERLRHAIARARRTGVAGALLFIDLDDFKSINDRHGHDTGDRMLVLAAQRLAQAVRASDTVARWGGDEFAVILEGVGQRDVAHAKGRRLLECLAEPTEAEDVPSALKASVGVALFPEDGEDAATLMAQADHRMYRAKGRSLLWSVFRRG
jgi:diguanylate cyclase (GGDEF)-like protein